MSASWTIEHGGSYVSFASLGLGNLTRTLTTLGPDMVTFTAPGADFDGDALFSYGATVRIKKDGVQWFYGRVISLPRQGSASEEQINYQLAGPWWYLDKCVYQQSWKVYDGGLVDANKSRVILNQNASGSRITSGAQINDALNWAIGKGAPIQLGTVDPDINLPFDEQTDISCAEVILKMLRWSPDVVTWFDYSTLTPTFHARKRSNLTAVSLAIGTDEIDNIMITPRHDLQIPGVVIHYEQTNEVDGVTYESITLDTAGTTDAFNTLHCTIELSGFRATYLTQKIVTENWPDPMTTKSWWKSHVPALASILDADLTIHDVSRSGTKDRILTEGQVQDWMTGYSAEEDVVTAQADLKEKDASSNVVVERKNQVIKLTLVGTNCSTRTYRKLDSFEEGESVPSGVADAVYAAWNQLQYDGNMSLTEDEVSGNVIPGRKLNLTGGRASWAAMNALVQQVTENVDTGQTSITIGPARHLGPDDLVVLLRASRTRRPAWKYVARTSGQSGDGGSVDLSGLAVRNDSSRTTGETLNMLLSATAGRTYAAKLNLDPSQVSDDTQIHELKPRECYVIESGDTSTAKKRQVLASAAYGSVINLGAQNPGATIQTLGSAAEGSETADTTDFTIGTDGKGLKKYYVSRIVWNHSGDKILYMMMRYDLIDKYGKHYYTSAETRVSVDEGEAH